MDREPSSEDRASRDAVEGSKVTEEEFVTRSRPANAPARPTLPIRSKSTRGVLARAAWAQIARKKAVMSREHDLRRDLHAIACWGGVSCTMRGRDKRRVRNALATRHQLLNVCLCQPFPDPICIYTAGTVCQRSCLSPCSVGKYKYSMPDREVYIHKSIKGTGESRQLHITIDELTAYFVSTVHCPNFS